MVPTSGHAGSNDGLKWYPPVSVDPMIAGTNCQRAGMGSRVEVREDP
jgi:hypothetical protein